MRCPKAYHVGDFCIPAGSEVLGGFNIICSDHDAEARKAMSHINVNWCFMCSKGKQNSFV